ncbi:release factor glutamine methyltransferase [Lebetimonas natsushimae]|uniref:peptide chain release factor N(5)-glutamine methyltransferase n=1 Tax=Lebetimonas natsushimae TaxID=1936991 RepID=A0A292YBK7_9BACT|nr:peptide chain release factor N(5)-glutamine methyltransferase [Lebetimonas natsushimae]GAX87487.1 release factor glutamine methyltransferase [Lebetimonas natsushimae]
MKIKDALKLKNGDYILEKILNKDKVWLFLNDDKKIPKEFFEIYEKVESGYPIEYIFNEVYFYGDKFFIKEGVLIPRDDTEVVVERAIKLINKLKIENGKLKVIDCCTGSGVIAIEIAKHTNATVIATDINEIALEVAKKNAKLHNVEAEFKKCDLFNECADVLIANPPYVEITHKKPNDYEPDEAFYGGVDGLDIVKKIILKAKKMNFKALVLEIGYNQQLLLTKFLKEQNINNFEFFKDLAGNIRGVEIILDENS